MSAHFDFGGISLERFYHFICRSDRPTLDLLQELGISQKLKRRETSMGFYSQGQLIPWGNPLSLLRVPRCSLMTKLRYGIFVFACMHRSDWSTLEKTDAKTWVTRWCGAEGYNRFWRSLLDYKFHEYSDRISAAWIWSRIRRMGESRKSMMVEELGYLEGGSQTLVDAMALRRRPDQYRRRHRTSDHLAWYARHCSVHCVAASSKTPRCRDAVVLWTLSLVLHLPLHAVVLPAAIFSSREADLPSSVGPRRACIRVAAGEAQSSLYRDEVHVLDGGPL